MSTPDLEFEQRYVDRLYERLDFLHDRTEADLARTRLAGASGTPQARSERDAFATLYEARLVQLRGVEDKLCFGRLDMVDLTRHHIGRLGLFADDQTQLLVDWRAPGARDFYQATAAHPGAVQRRRHLQTRGREVTAIFDDVLQLDGDGAPDAAAVVEGTPTDGEALAADGVLIASLNAARTGRMSDIVATIQAEQDEIIRAPLEGVAVVQGGPGTGKTAVALHRAAYLLYTYRDRLASSGVLLVGPSSVFLKYISHVLPSLGETGVVTRTPADLFPGVTVTAAEPPRAAVLKGDAHMATVIARAVANRQRPPSQPRPLVVDGVSIRLRPRAVMAAIEAARRTGKPHNEARVTFVRSMLDHLANLVRHASGGSIDRHEHEDLVESLRSSRDVRRELNLAWPPLTAQQLLRDLFSSPDRLYAATPGMTNDERELLLRPRDAGWTLEDVALLDETAELLGYDDYAERAAAHQKAAERVQEERFAREVLRSVGGAAGQMLTAENLAGRFSESAEFRTVSELANDDRTWSYGHVIVDEAQELSPMMWRLLLRRCPSGSMTLVGDVAQTSSDSGAVSWQQMLDPLIPRRWKLYELTVNYRTPAQIMQVAGDTLTAAGVSVRLPQSVREGRDPIAAQHLDVTDADAVAEAIRAVAANLGNRRMVVITPELRREAITAATTPDGHGDTPAAGIDDQVAVTTAPGAKGLEFDVVIVVEPQEVLEESTHGANNLYVALTRATQNLMIIHSKPLPLGMTGLPEAVPSLLRQ